MVNVEDCTFSNKQANDSISLPSGSDRAGSLKSRVPDSSLMSAIGWSFILYSNFSNYSSACFVFASLVICYSNPQLLVYSVHLFIYKTTIFLRSKAI